MRETVDRHVGCLTMTVRLDVANLSDTGRKRPHNEDSTVTAPDLGLAVVADGMGGYKAGEVASAIAIKAIIDQVTRVLPTIRPGAIDQETGLSRASLLLRDAILQANGHIFHVAREVPQCQGMGTTVLATLFYDNHFAVAHVGDSRLYRLRGELLDRITNDHSLVQELIDRGFYTPAEAAENTPKNLVTRALGIDQTVEVDVKDETCEAGDIYLLCSDGLNDMVKDEDISLTLSKYSANLVQAASELIRLANENGGKDNASVVLVRPTVPAPSGMKRPFWKF